MGLRIGRGIEALRRATAEQQRGAPPVRVPFVDLLQRARDLKRTLELPLRGLQRTLDPLITELQTTGILLPQSRLEKIGRLLDSVENEIRRRSAAVVQRGGILFLGGEPTFEDLLRDIEGIQIAWEALGRWEPAINVAVFDAGAEDLREIIGITQAVDEDERAKLFELLQSAERGRMPVSTERRLEQAKSVLAFREALGEGPRGEFSADEVRASRNRARDRVRELSKRLEAERAPH